MMSLKKQILGLAMILLSSPSMADMFDSWYVATDIGRSKFGNSCSSTNVTFSSCKDYDFGQRTSTGLLVADFTNAEISYYSSGKTTLRNAGNTSRTIDSVEWQLSAIRYQPIGSGRFSAFGRLGLVHWEATEESSAAKRISTSGNSILLGVGGRFFLTKDVALRGQLETHKVGNTANTWSGSVYFLSAGLTYQFY
jgi:hypothetical protein